MSAIDDSSSSRSRRGRLTVINCRIAGWVCRGSDRRRWFRLFRFRSRRASQALFALARRPCADRESAAVEQPALRLVIQQVGPGLFREQVVPVQPRRFVFCMARSRRFELLAAGRGDGLRAVHGTRWGLGRSPCGQSRARENRRHRRACSYRQERRLGRHNGTGRAVYSNVGGTETLDQQSRERSISLDTTAPSL